LKGAAGVWSIVVAIEWVSQRRALTRLHETLEGRSLAPAELTQLRQLCDRRLLRASELVALAERAFPHGYPSLFSDLRRELVKAEVNEAFKQLDAYASACKTNAELRHSVSYIGKRALQVAMLVGAPLVALAPVLASRLNVSLPVLDPTSYYCGAGVLLAAASLIQLELARAERVLELHMTVGLQVEAARALALLGALGNDPRTPSEPVAGAMGQVLTLVGRTPTAPEGTAPTEAIASTIKAVLPGRP
jgi:hypothetical protein